MELTKLHIVALVVIGSACFTSAFFNTVTRFNSFILPRCFNQTSPNGKLLINGQEYPLAQTLDNFISLVEKFEAANPEMKLEDMLFIFLRNFTYENLYYRPKPSKFYVNFASGPRIGSITNLWKEGRSDQLPEHINPYDDAEICSLFYMLSHTVNDTAVVGEDETRTFSPPSNDGAAHADVKKTTRPREQGIVLNRDTNETVALSQVLLGLFLGIEGKEIPLSSLLPKLTEDNGYDGNKEQAVSPLLMMTLSDTLFMNKWSNMNDQKNLGLGENVEFYGENNKIININTDVICPTVFRLGVNETAYQTFSLIRGSTDGFLLGSVISEIYNQPMANLRLSQILLSYYSPMGIHISEKADGNFPHYSFCSRKDLLSLSLESVKNQMELLAAIVSESFEDDVKNTKLLENIWEDFSAKQGKIYPTSSEYCQKEIKVENLYCETPVDVIVVLDTTSTDEDIRLQQEIIGYMATELKLHNDRSTATVYLDHLNGSSSTEIEELIPQTYSSACIACYITQKDIPSGGVDRKIVFQAIDKILEDRKKEEEQLSGTPGKVVVYFNFKDKEEPDNRLDKIIYQLYRAHSEVPIIAVGRNEEVLKKYSGHNMFSVVRLINNEDTRKIGLNLAEKVCLGPASLQYSDCKLAKDEKNAVYEGFVTRSSVQHWGMDTQYFEKSYTAKMFFESTDGHIQVCHNRATTKPELEQKNCQNTNSTTRRLQFTENNPCKGLSRTSCPPMYFSVIGIEPNEKDQINNNHHCTEPGCMSLNQVKFKFSHEGIRCSGCSSLLSNSFLMLVSVLLAYVLCTK